MRQPVLVLALFVVCAAYPYAQPRPDFSGRWVLESAAAGGGGGGRGVGPLGPDVSIKQDSRSLTLVRTQGDQPVAASYNLDGSEIRNTVQGRGGAQEQISKAAWEGNKLRITTTVSLGGNAVEQVRVLSIEGGDLVVEQTSPGRDGGPGTTRFVYRRDTGRPIQDPCTVNPNLPVCQ